MLTIISVNVHDSISKLDSYRSGVTAIAIAEGLTNAVKARDPTLRSSTYGNADASAKYSAPSVSDGRPRPLAASTRSSGSGTSKSPRVSPLQTLRSSPFHLSPQAELF